MSATKTVEAVRKLFHFSRDGFRHYGKILVQHRREIDEFRSRLDTIQKLDTSDRRKLVVVPEKEYGRLDLDTDPDARQQFARRVRARARALRAGGGA